MFRNYFLITIRSIWRNPAFSLINIFGLSVGISAALVVYLLVFYEHTFDNFQADRQNTYRIVSSFYFSGDSVNNSGVAVPVGAAMKENIPGVEQLIPFFVNDIAGRITADGKDFPNKAEDIIFADKAFTGFMGYHWLAGTATAALEEPNGVVLTRSRAARYFPGLSPAQVLGRQLIYDDTVRTSVTGIVADLTENTNFDFKEFISISTMLTSGYRKYYSIEEWDNTSSAAQLLVKLKPGTDVNKVTAQLAAIRNQHKDDDHTVTVLQLQPFGDIHFNRAFDGIGHIANTKLLYALSLVALALLLLACINFINLTTAQAAKRSRETGIRKAMGSTIRQLVGQFLGETLLLTIIASLMALLLAPVLIISFHSFLPDGFTPWQLYTWPVFVFLIVLAVVVALFSGIYPAFVLSRFQPAEVLKAQVQHTGGKLWLRKTLTISQFVIAQFFIIATIIVSKQINYAVNRDLGFRKNAILTVRTPFHEKDSNKRNTLQEKLSAVPGVAMVSQANRPPIIGGNMTTTFKYKDGKKEIEKSMEMRYGDSLYTKIYQLKILAGRNLTSSDTIKEWLFNEKAVHAFGFRDPQDILGVVFNGHPVVGVVNNFHASNMHSEIPVMAIGCDAIRQHRTMHILLRDAGKDGIVWKNAISGIEKAWNEVYPREEFSYEFLDKTIARLYEDEQRTATLLNWCAGMAFFISALGLLGLVIYTTNQRTREIGIRKVLGASVWQMISLLTIDFMKLVGVAFVLAIPLSWWAMDQWLSAYAYRTALSWWVFVAGGILMAILALATMSIKTIRAALSNPVTSLKAE